MDAQDLLALSGLLTAFIGFTLPVLTLVIFLKEPPERADVLDKTLLFIIMGLLGVLLVVSGGAVLNGVATDIDFEYYQDLIVFDLFLRAIIFIAAWTKIIRTLLKQGKTTGTWKR